MSASPVVDMHSWRAQARVVRPATAPLPDATSSAGVAAAAAAVVVHLPDLSGRAVAADRPLSVFGPVMAFGLRPRAAGAAAAPAAPAAPGGQPEAEEVPLAPGVIRLRPRLHADPRGSSRGPRR